MKVMFGLDLTKGLRFFLDIPRHAYYAMAVIALAVIGALAFGNMIEAEVGPHHFKLRPVVNREAKADFLKPTFNERFESFEVEKPPFPWTGPMVNLTPSPWPEMKSPAPARKPLKVVDNFYYEVTVAEQGDADELQFKSEKRPCAWPHEFPPACSYPQNERWKLPMYRFDPR